MKTRLTAIHAWGRSPEGFGDQGVGEGPGSFSAGGGFGTAGGDAPGGYLGGSGRRSPAAEAAARQAASRQAAAQRAAAQRAAAARAAIRAADRAAAGRLEASRVKETATAPAPRTSAGKQVAKAIGFGALAITNPGAALSMLLGVGGKKAADKVADKAAETVKDKAPGVAAAVDQLRNLPGRAMDMADNLLFNPMMEDFEMAKSVVQEHGLFASRDEIEAMGPQYAAALARMDASRAQLEADRAAGDVPEGWDAARRHDLPSWRRTPAAAILAAGPTPSGDSGEPEAPSGEIPSAPPPDTTWLDTLDTQLALLARQDRKRKEAERAGVFGRAAFV